jgi:hypothetical protein
MPHRRFASTRPDQLFETAEGQLGILSQVTSRQGSVSWACKPACKLSVAIGSLQALWLIATWSEAS